MQKNIIIGASIILAVIIVFYILNYSPTQEPQSACTMEAKICPDGSAVGRTGPNCEFAPCPIVENPPVTDELIIIETPVPNQKVSSPIMVVGKARGNWFFEASFPIVVTNWDGLIIGQGIATAQGDWMTAEFVPFTASISYTLPSETPYNRGTLILRKDNPSGLSEHDEAREIPIIFSIDSKETIPPTNSTLPKIDEDTTICTMEAKICPDGSAVGRTGPNCEFAPCPL